MIIECPNCHRKGNIPDRFGLTPHRIRCRRCLARFTTSPFAVAGVETVLTSIEDNDGDDPISDQLDPIAPLNVDSREFDEREALMSGMRGPGDSHYELPADNFADIDDSQVEIPVLASSDGPLSDEYPTVPDDPPSGEIEIPDNGVASPAVSWVRYQFYAAILLGSLSLATLGLLVIQMVTNAQRFGSPIGILVAGCLCIGALLFFSIARRPLPLLFNEIYKHSRGNGPRSQLKQTIANE